MHMTATRARPPLRASSLPRQASAQNARLLRDLLRAEILRGEFPDGLLPSETDLMASYQSTRATVREALDLLRRAGLLERMKGTGTLVVAQRYAMRLVEAHGVAPAAPRGRLTGFTAQVLDKKIVPMPVTVASYLEEQPGTPCLLLEYIGHDRGRIVGVYTNYLRFPEASAVMAAPFNSHWYHLMEDAGLDVAESDFLLECTLADALLADLLEIPPGAPIVAMQQVIRDGDGRPYDFAILRSRADAMALLSDVSNPEILVHRDRAR
jgi:GntR family transcriptional regulator